MSRVTRLASWDNFYNLMIRGLKVFLFYLSVLSICRGIFLALMSEYMGAGTGSADVGLALFGGTKLSVQTAGIIMLVILVPAWAGNIVSSRMERLLGRVMSGIVSLVTAVLFLGSFPYYRQFHSRYHQIMFNATNDDMYALTVSLIQEFNLPLKLAAAVVLAAGLWWLLDRFIGLQVAEILGLNGCLKRFGTAGAWIERVGLVVVVFTAGRLAFFGGSFGWETAVNWENAGITKDPFLNEVILDDYQAVYRGYRMNGRLLACNGLDFTTDQIKMLAAHVSNKPADSDNLEYYMKRSAQGAQIEKPQHVFVILSESYANWPLLSKYSQLHIADGIKGIIAGEDAEYCRSFLPAGGSTVSAVTSVVTGLADANLYLTTMPESFDKPYATAIAPQMSRLGYKTNFWYAGPATWERVGAFTIGQGFDHFYGKGDMPSDAEGSVWGCDDEYLYRAVLDGTPADKASFNIILNVSNHSPFNVDLESKGFVRQAVIDALPDEAKGDDELVTELGHFWYADRELAKFVTEIKKKYENSLIIIVGDHAERYNIDKTPSVYERYSVPFIMTGKSVHKGLLLPDAAGSQIDIGPTLVEMIAPQGFEYFAVGSSLTRNNRMGINYGVWITHDYAGEADTAQLLPVPIDGGGKSIDLNELQQYIDAMRSISWWWPKYGPILRPELLEGSN